MCTVTYIPTHKGYILTSSRDENPLRGNAVPPQRHLVNKQVIYYPEDPVSGGTWMVTSQSNHTLCLLNGAFKQHTKLTSYRHSRGKVLLDFFQYPDFQEFINNYEMEGLEPFTVLCIYQLRETIDFMVLRWDGEAKHIETLDATMPYIFSSATLYAPFVQNERRAWFQSFLDGKRQQSDKQDMIDFHLHTQAHDLYNGLRIHRHQSLQTVSICCIERAAHLGAILYIDLLDNKTYAIDICF